MGWIDFECRVMESAVEMRRFDFAYANDRLDRLLMMCHGIDSRNEAIRFLRSMIRRGRLPSSGATKR